MILLVSSSGGVLLDLLALRPWWSRHDVRWVAVEATDTREMLAGGDVSWENELRPDQPIRLLSAVVRALRDLIQDPPDAVVSAGSGVAVSYFIAARLLRVPTIWVETFNIVGTSGLAARLCMRLSTRVLVQRPELLTSRPRAVFVGELY